MLSGSELQGESYSAFRDRVRSLRLPLVEAHRAAFDVMYACNEENVAKVSTLPETSPGIADTDEAQAKIERLQELNQAYMRLIDADPPGTSNDAVRSVEGAIRVNEDLIASLRDVIYQIEDYAARSVGIYARARSAVDVLREAGASVKSCLVGNGYGDLSWADGFAEGDDELVVERLGVSKEDFVTMQRDQFGFNAETAETMWDIYAALYRRYPDLSQEKIAWRPPHTSRPIVQTL